MVIGKMYHMSFDTGMAGEVVISVLLVRARCSSGGHRFTGAGTGAAGNRHCIKAVSNVQKIKGILQVQTANVNQAMKHVSLSKKLKMQKGLQYADGLISKLKNGCNLFFQARKSQQRVPEEAQKRCTGT